MVEATEFPNGFDVADERGDEIWVLNNGKMDLPSTGMRKMISRDEFREGGH